MTERGKEYWDSKHPQIAQVYEGRFIPGHKRVVAFDVRHFIWADDVELKRILVDEIFGSAEAINAASFDERAHRIQKWVVHGERKVGKRKKKVATYVSDKKARGYNEFWQFPAESLALRKGDCEDFAIVIASLMRCARIPAWRVRVAAGWVKPSPTAPNGGHGYCTYCRETDSEHIALDWCLHEDSHLAVEDKPLLHDRTEYGEVFFSFNDLYAWSHTTFRMKGRVQDQ